MKALAVFLIALLLPLAGFAQQQGQPQKEEPLIGTGPLPDNVPLGGPMKFHQIDQHTLLMYGGIHIGDDEHFRTALAAGPWHTLWLASGGGVVSVALNIAHQVRAKKMTTRVPKGAKCISACNFIFLGGVVRYVEPGGLFMVHMFSGDWVNQFKVLLMGSAAPTTLVGLVEVFQELARETPDIVSVPDAMSPQEFESDVHQVQVPIEAALAAIKQKGQPKDPNEIASETYQYVVQQNLRLEPDFEKIVVIYAVNHNGTVSCRGTPVPGVQQAAQPQPSQPQQAPQAKPQKTAAPAPASQPETLWDQLNDPSRSPARKQPQPEEQPQQQPQEQPQPQQAQQQQAIDVDFPNDACLEGLVQVYLTNQTIVEEVKRVEMSSAQQAAELATFFIQMEISLRFLTAFSNIPNDVPRALTTDELRSFNIVNTDE